MSLPPTTSQPRHPIAPTLRDTPLSLPSLEATLRREAPSLAYLFGAWAGLAEVGGEPERRIAFASKDIRQIELIQHHLIAVVGSSPASYPLTLRGCDYQRVELNNNALVEHMNEVTASNSRVPWEHLGSTAEHSMFLRGMFDHGGWIFQGKSAGIGIGKKGGEAFLYDVSRVFVKLGLHPLFAEGEVASLKFKDRGEWPIFAEEVGASLPERQQELAQLCARPSVRNKFGVKDFESVQTCIEAGIVQPSEISRATSVPVNTVRDWIYRGEMPPVVKRRDALLDATDSLPKGEVINLAYRHFGASSALARECGAKASLSAVQQTFEHHSDELSQIYGDDAKIARLLLGTKSHCV